MSVFTDTFLTINQMPERAMRAPLIKGILTTLAVMVALGLTIGAPSPRWPLPSFRRQRLR